MLRIGFACAWEPTPEATWSHIPWNLREALRSHADVVDLDLDYPPALRQVLRYAHARRVNGRWATLWRHGPGARRYTEARLRRLPAELALDAVVEIGDPGPTSVPFYMFEDLSWDAVIEMWGPTGTALQFPSLRPRALLTLRDRQRKLYASAGGVLAMSRWLAAAIVEHSQVDPAKVHVVHPGVNFRGLTAAGVADATARRQAGPRRRLLFVGVDFMRKAGPQVVDALAILRRDVDPAISLTVAGPAEWPLPGPVPAGVTFLGSVPVDRVADLYDQHDLLVLPSRFEPFGIAFVEALARGMPCIGRDAFAMPEIIEEGVTGALIASNDASELAAAINAALVNDDLFRTTSEKAAATRDYYTWDRAAADVVKALSSPAAAAGPVTLS